MAARKGLTVAPASAIGRRWRFSAQADGAMLRSPVVVPSVCHHNGPLTEAIRLSHALRIPTHHPANQTRLRG